MQLVPGKYELTNVSVVTSGKTINDIKVGDVITITTNESPLQVLHDTTVIGIDSTSIFKTIYLNKQIVGSSTATVRCIANRNERVVLTNGNDVETFYVDTCTGSTHIGSHFGRIDIEFGSLGSDGSSISNTSDIVSQFNSGTLKVAYSYWFDPKTVADGGPATTIRTGVAGVGSNIQVPVQSLGVDDGAFAVNDLVFIGEATAASTGIGNFTIAKINGIIDNPTNYTLVVEIADFSTDASYVLSNADPAFASGNVVRRVLLHREFANIIDCEIRTRTISGAQTQYCSIILDRGYIVQQKQDYLGWIVLCDETHSSQVFAVVNGRLQGVVHTATMNEQTTDGGVAYRTGDLTVSADVRLIGGNFEIFDSINQTRVFGFVNDDGHADHQGLLVWDAGVVARGDFYLFSEVDPENVVYRPDSEVPSFSVDNSGNVTAKTSLTVSGLATASPSTIEGQLLVQNLGVNGTKEFSVKQDNSINSFGITNFYTSSGARHTRYLSAASPEEDLTLTPNIVYCVNVQAQSTLILTMPTSPQTGDTVRIVEIGGRLSYDTTLVLRTSESSGVRIQGDATGTLLGGRITPYPSGELVVQTPNAAFTLVYLGSTDNNGQVGIPSSSQGWWLMEV